MHLRRLEKGLQQHYFTVGHLHMISPSYFEKLNGCCFVCFIMHEVDSKGFEFK